MNLISPPELAYITDSLLARKRVDGRALLQFRDIHLSTRVIAQSAGSARVNSAGTDVLVGIRLETRSANNENLKIDGEEMQVSLEV